MTNYNASYISTINSQIAAIDLASLSTKLQHKKSTTTTKVPNDTMAGSLGGVKSALDAIHTAYDSIEISGKTSELDSYIAKFNSSTPPTPTELDKLLASLKNISVNSLKDQMLTKYQSNSTSLTYNKDAITYYKNVFKQIKDHGYNAQDDEKMKSPEWLQGQIDMGNIFLFENDPKTNEMKNLSWTTGDNTLKETHDDTDTVKAKAEYDVTVSAIQSKEKRMDLDLKQIDTEHSATQTEIESLSKIINKNIERTLKIFDA